MGINKKRIGRSEKIMKTAHLNWMGGTSYDINNPIHNLRLAASSCFFGEPQYYHREGKGKARNRTGRNTPRSALTGSHIDRLDRTLTSLNPVDWRGKTPTQLMEHAIDKALDFDPEATLREAVRLRNEENIRTTPQVILVRAAHHARVKGTGLIRKYAPQIVSRGDEPAVCMAYQIEKFGRKKIPNSLKRALADKLTNMTDYQLAKYRMEDRVVSTVDVVNLVHPKATPALNQLVNGTLKITGQTWEAVRSAGGSWEDAIETMGHMALLRNLRNLGQNNVSPDLYLGKLVDTAVKGRQLPFRYYSAYKALKSGGCDNPRVLDAVEECLEISFTNAPYFAGKTISLCDNSGSATNTSQSSMGTMRICDIANITGIITGKASEEGYVGVFGDNLAIMPVRKRESIFTMTDKAGRLGNSIGAGTENGIWIFWRDAIKNKVHYDNVFVYSDMQAGHGGLYGVNPRDYSNYICGAGMGRYIDVPKLINQYRLVVNPDVNVFLVQVAGYQDTIVPEFYNKTYVLGGWGDGILRFAAEMAGFVSGDNSVVRQQV